MLYSDCGLVIDNEYMKVWAKNGILDDPINPSIVYPDGLTQWYVNGVHWKSEMPNHWKRQPIGSTKTLETPKIFETYFKKLIKFVEMEQEMGTGDISRFHCDRFHLTPGELEQLTPGELDFYKLIRNELNKIRIKSELD